MTRNVQASPTVPAPQPRPCAVRCPVCLGPGRTSRAILTHGGDLTSADCDTRTYRCAACHGEGYIVIWRLE